jgi:hypothetical protein
VARLARDRRARRRSRDGMAAAWNACGKDLATAVVLDDGAAYQEEVADGLACSGTDEIATARDWEIDGQLDFGKMHELSIETLRSRRTSERAGSRVGAQGRLGSGHDPRGLPSPGAGPVRPRFSGPRSRTVQLRKGIGSAARALLGRGPARHAPTSQRKASGTIAMTQGAGPKLDLHRAHRCSVGGRRRGPRAGQSRTQRRTFRQHGDSPKLIDDQSVIGPAGEGAEERRELRQDKESLHVRRKLAAPQAMPRSTPLVE